MMTQSYGNVVNRMLCLRISTCEFVIHLKTILEQLGTPTFRPLDQSWGVTEVGIFSHLVGDVFIDWSVCLLALKHLVSLQARVRSSVQAELDLHTTDSHDNRFKRTSPHRATVQNWYSWFRQTWPPDFSVLCFFHLNMSLRNRYHSVPGTQWLAVTKEKLKYGEIWWFHVSRIPFTVPKKSPWFQVLPEKHRSGRSQRPDLRQRSDKVLTCDMVHKRVYKDVTSSL
jgi:hypothetical protein